ncbi:MAG: ABC transporter permease [Maricaulaceae bacterium]
MTNLSASAIPHTGAWGRIMALILRQWRLMSGSWPRVVDILYWPTVNVAIWGFLQLHVLEMSTAAAVAVSALLGAVMLWDLCWRSQLGLALALYEEIWSRNLGHLLASPLRAHELILAAMAISLLKTAIAVLPAAALASWLFGFDIWSLGPALALFVVNLVLFAWSISLVAAGLVLRYGQGAQDMPWALMFGVAPFAAIYYPVSVLPDAVRWIAAIVPPAHVFEGLRAVILEDRFDAGALSAAFGLNLIWIGAGLAGFYALLAATRERGGLLQVGE